MGERLTITPEHEKNNDELEALNIEKSAELEKNRGEKAERSVETSAEEAREDIERTIEKADRDTAEKQQKSVAEKRRDAPLPQERKKREQQTFKRNMEEAQTQMSAPARTFSKVIHNPVVEKTSEVAGSTIARPNAILAGSLTAFLLTLAVYVVARSLGYPLSGFETIAAFVLGWVIGLLFDYIRVMVTGKNV